MTFYFPHKYFKIYVLEPQGNKAPLLHVLYYFSLPNKALLYNIKCLLPPPQTFHCWGIEPCPLPMHLGLAFAMHQRTPGRLRFGTVFNWDTFHKATLLFIQAWVGNSAH